MKLLKSFFSLLLLLSVVCIQSSFAQDSTIPLADNVEITDSEGQSYQAVETVLVNAISDLSDGFIDPQELETADYLVSTGPQGVLVTNEEVAPRPKPAFSYLSHREVSHHLNFPQHLGHGQLLPRATEPDESRSRSQNASADLSHAITLLDDPLLSPRVAETDDGRVIKGRTYIYDWNGAKLIWSHRLE